MDKATIEAIRNLIVAVDAIMAPAKRSGSDSVYLKDGRYMKASVLADGLKVLQAMVGEAAAERAEPVAAEGTDAVKLMRDLHYALNWVTQEAEKNDDACIYFKADGCRPYGIYTVNARATVRAIEAMLAVPPTTAASEDGPTTWGYIEALNRNEYLGASDWTIVVTSQGADHTIDADVCRRVAEWLIAREKAAEGGA